MHTLRSNFFQQYFLKLKINFYISNACNEGNQIAWKLRETANDAKLNNNIIRIVPIAQIAPIRLGALGLDLVFAMFSSCHA